MTTMTVPELLRLAAEGRREYAKNSPGVMRSMLLGELLHSEADILDAAAKIADGDTAPLYGLLPSWMWEEAGLR